ncbi:phosphatase 2C-like domain-containing protein [Paraphysoderma sedebokerense]|nr:phosphatase 2C-like domain-containing protein [Paraphysoderma sedebokerense]
MQNQFSKGPQVTFGMSRKQGGRKYQQDEFDIVDNMSKGEGYALFMIFDGHGSNRYSAHSANNMADLIIHSPEFRDGNYAEAIYKAFLKEDKLLFREVLPKDKKGGTTATVCLIVKDTLYAANVGDSSAILAEKLDDDSYNVYRVSKDDKPGLETERRRLEKTGAFVKLGRIYTEGHSINMSRALGDFDFKQPKNDAPGDWISPVPHVHQIKLNPRSEFLVVASDGLWNAIDDFRLVDAVSSLKEKGHSEKDICKAITNEVAKIPVSDNVTMILVSFDWGSQGRLEAEE